MKKELILLVICICFIFSENSLFSQIVIKDFKFLPYNAPPSLNMFKAKLSEKLNKSYYILESKIEDINDEITISYIRDYFRNAIDPNFVPTCYLLYCNVSLQCSPNTPKYGDIWNINIELVNVENRKKYPIYAENIDIDNLEIVVEYIYNYIQFTIPTYYKINTFVNNENIMINYGNNRSAEDGDELEIISIDNRNTIGFLEVDNVYEESSDCEFSLNDGYEQIFNRRTYSQYCASTRTNKKEAEKYLTKIKDMYEECRISPPPPPTNVFVVTLENFWFKKETIKQYFDKETYKPYIFGAQLNVGSSAFGFYVKGRISGLSEIDEVYEGNSGLARFSFYQGGGGMQINFILGNNVIIPGVNLGAYYTEMRVSHEGSNGSISAIDYYKGLDLEINAHCSVRFWKLGFYGEMAYSYFPMLKSGNENWETSAFSVGLGLGWFF